MVSVCWIWPNLSEDGTYFSGFPPFRIFCHLFDLFGQLSTLRNLFVRNLMASYKEILQLQRNWSDREIPFNITWLACWSIHISGHGLFSLFLASCEEINLTLIVYTERWHLDSTSLVHGTITDDDHCFENDPPSIKGYNRVKYLYDTGHEHETEKHLFLRDSHGIYIYKWFYGGGTSIWQQV